jgi:hypothetical protein
LPGLLLHFSFSSNRRDGRKLIAALSVLFHIHRKLIFGGLSGLTLAMGN